MNQQVVNSKNDRVKGVSLVKEFRVFVHGNGIPLSILVMSILGSVASILMVVGQNALANSTVIVGVIGVLVGTVTYYFPSVVKGFQEEQERKRKLLYGEDEYLEEKAEPLDEIESTVTLYAFEIPPSFLEVQQYHKELDRNSQYNIATKLNTLGALFNKIGEAPENRRQDLQIRYEFLLEKVAEIVGEDHWGPLVKGEHWAALVANGSKGVSEKLAEVEAKVEQVSSSLFWELEENEEADVSVAMVMIDQLTQQGLPQT